MEMCIKDSQKEAPSNFAKPGRFWGVMDLRVVPVYAGSNGERPRNNGKN
jgi:hypothetical protein